MHKFGEYLKYRKAATEVYQTETIDSRLRYGSVQPAGHCPFYCVYTKGTTPKLQKHGYKNLRGEKLAFKECTYFNTHG